MSWRRRYCLGSRKRWRNQCESDIKKMPYPQKIRSSASRFTAHTHTRIITHWATTLVSNASPHSLLSPPPQKQPPAEPHPLTHTDKHSYTHRNTTSQMYSNVTAGSLVSAVTSSEDAPSSAEEEAVPTTAAALGSSRVICRGADDGVSSTWVFIRPSELNVLIAVAAPLVLASPPHVVLARASVDARGEVGCAIFPR